VSAGMMDALINHLADGNLADNEFIKVFLLTHRCFTESTKLLVILIQRFYIEPPKNCSPEKNAKFQ